MVGWMTSLVAGVSGSAPIECQISKAGGIARKMLLCSIVPYFLSLYFDFRVDLLFFIGPRDKSDGGALTFEGWIV